MILWGIKSKNTYTEKLVDGEEKAMKMINTSECEKCSFGTIDDTNKGRIIVHCNSKNKDYVYGACIPCEEGNKNGKHKN